MTMFNPCGCCNSSSCVGECVGYLSTDSSFYYLESGLNYKCWADQFGNIYNITSSGWMSSTGNIITYDCSSNCYLVNGIASSCPSGPGPSPYTISPITDSGTCIQAQTCCAEYPTNLYLHVTSSDCSWLNQVILLYQNPLFRTYCKAPAFVSTTGAFTCEGYDYFNSLCIPAEVFCNNTSGSASTDWGLLISFGPFRKNPHDPFPVCNVDMTWSEDGNFFYPTVPISPDAVSCDPVDLTWTDIPFDADYGGTLHGSSSPGPVSPFLGEEIDIVFDDNCCVADDTTATFIAFGPDSNLEITFDITGSNCPDDHVKCCGDLNGHYRLVETSFIAPGSWNANDTVGEVPSPGITASYTPNSGSILPGPDSLSISNNNICPNNCTITFHVTESSMHMMGAPPASMPEVPQYIADMFLDKNINREQKLYLMNRIKKGLPQPIKEATGFLKKIKTFGTAIVEHAKTGLGNVSEQEKAYRLKICERCEYLMDNRSCSQCGCFIDVKVGWAEQECPLLKWTPTVFSNKQGCGSCGKKKS